MGTHNKKQQIKIKFCGKKGTGKREPGIKDFPDLKVTYM
jgi:hypothetical protein